MCSSKTVFNVVGTITKGKSCMSEENQKKKKKLVVLFIISPPLRLCFIFLDSILQGYWATFWTVFWIEFWTSIFGQHR